MPATIYRREQDARRADVYEVQPTILIGLGGTGKEVLLRLRQRFFERYSVTGFPTMAYLWVDTDTQNQNIDGRPIDYITQEARFHEGEWVDAQVSGNDFQAIFTNPHTNRHIFRWINPALAAQGSVLNGSRQIRPLGRLGFFYAYHTIQRRLDTLRNQVMSMQAHQDMVARYGMQVGTSSGFQVILVCSLAGGTGSGMFLDMAFLVRQMFAAMNIDVVGYLVLPSVFAPVGPDSKSMYANAYAALKELEFYSMRKDLLRGEAVLQVGSEGRFTSAHDFVVDWSNSGLPLSIPGPPFNTCYLIGNQTLGGGSIGAEGKTHLCDMIAESIFIDFRAEAFSDMKRSVRSNLDTCLTGALEYQYLDVQGKPIYSEVFSCRYSSMGFTMMHVPTDRIRKACAYQLGLDLIDRWLAHNAVPGTLEEYLRVNILPQLELRVSCSTDDFRTALECSDDTGQTFWQEIMTAWSDREKQFLLDRVHSAAPNLKAEIERSMQGYANDKLAKPRDEEQWGTFVRRLELENRKTFFNTRYNAILTAVKAWLKNQHIRFDTAVEYLHALHIIMEKHRDFFMQARDRSAQMSESLRGDIRALSDIIDEEEHGWWVHRWSLRVLVEEICEKIRQHFEYCMRSLVFGVAAELCSELQAFIGSLTVEKHLDGSEVVTRAGLLHEIWRLAEHLRDMRRDLQARLAAFDCTESHLIFENLYSRGMFKDYYKLQRTDGAKVPIDLHQMEQVYYAEAGIDGPYDLIARAQQVEMANVRKANALEEFCLAWFRHLDVDVDIVHAFYSAYPESNMRHQALVRFVRNGTVWWQPNWRAKVESFIIGNYEDDVEIGIHQSGVEHHYYYQDLSQDIVRLVQEANFRSPINPPVDTQRDTVYLYSEIAGIPLVCINNIEAYKWAYVELASRGRALHIDSSDKEFADIVIKDSDEIAETIHINNILFIGAILRVIGLSNYEGRIQYYYLEREALTPLRRPLGSQAVAVETLRVNRELRNRIEREVNEIRQTLRMQTRQHFLTVLMYHIMDGSIPGTARGPYPPTYITVGGRIIEKYSPEHYAINEVIHEENRFLQDMMEADPEKVLQVALELYERLDAFSDQVVFGDKIHRILKESALEVRAPVVSPYIVGAPVPAKRLVGREDVFVQIEAVWAKPGQCDSLIIFGHRRMGKSSIVRNLLHFCTLRDTSLAVLNLQSIDWSQGLSDLCYAIAFELWNATPTLLDEPLPDAYQQHPLTALRRLLANLDRLDGRGRYILILDEYELLDQNLPTATANTFVTMLRGFSQQYPWLVMALVGLHTLEERSASFYEAIYTWRLIRVGLMNADAVADVLQVEDDRFPLEYSQEAVVRAHQLTGGQPFLVQLLGDSLVQRFNRQLHQQRDPPHPIFSADDVNTVVEDPQFYQQGDAYFRGIWAQAGESPRGQHALLRVLAPHTAGLEQSALQQASGLDPDAFSAALAALCRHDVVVCSDGLCHYSVELMRRWVEVGAFK